MDTLRIPKQCISQYETTFDKIKLLNEAGLHLDIDKVNWPSQFPKTMPVSVHIAHDNKKVYLYYQVKGEQLRAVATEDFMDVYKDSCVEFFVKRKGGKIYRNFEFNVLGVLLGAEHETREIAEDFPPALMASVLRFTTINHYYEGDKQLSDWTLYAEIPKEAIGFSSDERLSKQSIEANFYKCGDETPEPHYITWNPIDLPEPDYHVPQFFGELTFE